MGLRITDRVRPKPAPSSEEIERRHGLEWEAARKFVAFAREEVTADRFLAKLHDTHERLLDPEEMLDRAMEIRALIRLQRDACPIHAKIDIATLIELL